MLREYVLNGLIDEEDAELIQKYREMLRGIKVAGIGPSNHATGWYLGPTEDCDGGTSFEELQDDLDSMMRQLMRSIVNHENSGQ